MPELAAPKPDLFRRSQTSHGLPVHPHQELPRAERRAREQHLEVFATTCRATARGEGG